MVASRWFHCACLGTLVWGCSVYDASLQDPGPTGAGGAAGSEIVGPGGASATDGSAAATTVGAGGSASAGAGTTGGASGTGASGAGGGAGGGGASSGGQAGSPGGGGVAGGVGSSSAGGSSAAGGAVSAGGTSGAGGGPVGDAGCVAEGSAAFCVRVGKNCGTVSGNDNCGSPISTNCGTCAPLVTCGGAGRGNVCGAPPNLAQGGTVSASNPGVSPEDMTKAFDGKSASKWFAGNGVTTGWIAYQFAGSTSHTVTSYAITSANDMPARDPFDWQLQGSNDGTTWTTVDTRASQVFVNRFQTNGYACVNSTAYQRYRLNVTANSGGNELQLAEIQLFGN